MESKINIEFNQNEDNMKLMISEMKQKINIIKLGGGTDKIKKQHDKGKLTARERINLLIDSNCQYIEIGILAADELYEEFGGCPSELSIVLNAVKNKIISYFIYS